MSSSLMMNTASMPATMPADDFLLNEYFNFEEDEFGCTSLDYLTWQDYPAVGTNDAVVCVETNSMPMETYCVPAPVEYQVPNASYAPVSEEDQYYALMNFECGSDEDSLSFRSTCFSDEEKEVYAYASYVADQHQFGSHFYRNINVLELSDSMVEHLEAFYKARIGSVNKISDLKVVLEKICLQKAPLMKALTQVSSIPECKLKEQMKEASTSQVRCLLLALVVNRAMQILDGTNPKLLLKYSNQLDCEAEFYDLWQGYSDFAELDLVTKCMAVFKVIHHELGLDCSHGKKGLVITAAIMIADAQRTYTNGGSQARWVKVLEDMFHRITGCTVKPRGTKRSADEMSADDN